MISILSYQWIQAVLAKVITQNKHIEENERRVHL